LQKINSLDSNPSGFCPCLQKKNLLHLFHWKQQSLHGKTSTGIIGTAKKSKAK
jgi:hypothetical protein